MNPIFFIFALAISISFIPRTGAYAKDRKVKVYIQANPVINATLFNSSNEEGKTQMQPTHVNFGFGAEAEVLLSKRTSVVPFVKWYTQKQTVRQSDMFDLFKTGSYFYRGWAYWNLNVGALVEYQVWSHKASGVQALLGISFSHIYQYENSKGDRIFSKANLQQRVAYTYGSDQLMDDFSKKVNTPNIAVGSRYQIEIKKLGLFKMGFLLFIPMVRMPTYDFNSTIAVGNSEYNTRTLTTSRQLNIELSIMYNIIEF